MPIETNITPAFLRTEVAAVLTAALPQGAASAFRTAPAAATDGKSVEGYFVTGSTGFLGGWVTHLLAQRLPPTAPVFLLARRGEAETRELLARKGLQVPGGAVFLKGDLSQPDMGLTADDFARVRAATRYYVHCAAHVVFGCSYAEAKPGTVNGARSVLSLYSGARQDAELHYISTNGVYPPYFTKNNDGTPCRESLADFDAYAEKLQEGYGWSKWVAERAVVEACGAMDRPVRAYRPGNIGWSEDGRVNPNDFQTLMVYAFRALRAMPEVTAWNFEMTPVNVLAGFLLDNCRGTGASATHNVIGRRVKMATYMADTVGIDVVSMADWIAAAKVALAAPAGSQKADEDQHGVLSPRDRTAVEATLESFEEFVTLDMYLSDTNDYFSENSLCYDPSTKYMTCI